MSKTPTTLVSPMMQDLGAIALGAAVGAIMRHGVSTLQTRRGVKPWGIAGVNLAGSFILGALTVSTSLSPQARLMMATGFCGSLTTFSTYSVDVVHLIEAGRPSKALGYALVNNVGGILAAFAGMYVFRGGGGGGVGALGGAAIKPPLPKLPPLPPQPPGGK